MCVGEGELSLNRTAGKFSLAFSPLQIHCGTLGKSFYLSGPCFFVYRRMAIMSYGIGLL